MQAAKQKFCPAEVRKAQQLFERWRATKKGRERIPLELWKSAVDLCKSHSAHRVAKWLGLNITALKERASRPLSSKPAFVPLSLPAGIIPGVSQAEYVVEVPCRGNRAGRVHVRGAGAADVAALAKTLFIL